MSKKSFRYRTKENFDTCPRSEGLIITELCHFLWDQFMLTQHKVRIRIVKKMDVQNVGFHEKCHISVNMRPTDPRQVSKFSLVPYLKLFLWHPKDLVGRKNVLGRPKIFEKVTLFLLHPLCLNRTQWSKAQHIILIRVKEIHG